MFDNSSQSRADNLVDKYFSGLTSLGEEAELRRLLANEEITGEKADEARAVLSFASLSPEAAPIVRAGKSRKPTRIFLSAATSVAVIIALGWSLSRNSSETNYMASIDGNLTTDPQEVMAIINADLSLLGDASADFSNDVNTELSDISKAINLECTEI